MRIQWSVIGALAWLVILATPAAAANLSGEVVVVSDYHYRGVSLSEEDPALQASLNVDFGKGTYVDLWASTIKNEGKLRSELDFSMGREFELRPNVRLDVSATYYAYPASRPDNYAEVTAILSANLGAVTGKVGTSAAPAQRAMRDELGRKHGNLYFLGGAELALHLPVKLTANLGFERGAFDEVEGGGKWDWSVGAEARFKTLKVGLSYIDSTARQPALVGSLAVAF